MRNDIHPPGEVKPVSIEALDAGIEFKCAAPGFTRLGHQPVKKSPTMAA
jgi:hypothetical protein